MNFDPGQYIGLITLGLGVGDYGTLIDAQVGARLSERMQRNWIIRGLSVALGLVGLRILITAIQG